MGNNRSTAFALGKGERPLKSGKQVPASLIGLIERLFFTLVVAFDISGAAVAAMVWITVKMATNWNRLRNHNKWVAPFALTSLLGSLTSMLFAMVGGLICGGKIPFEGLFKQALDGPQDLVSIYKLLQAISIILALAGTCMLACGLRVKTGITNELAKKLEIEKQGLSPPSYVRQRTYLIACGLGLIFIAALVQLSTILYS